MDAGLTAPPDSYTIWVRAKNALPTADGWLRAEIYDDYPSGVITAQLSITYTFFHWYSFEYAKDDDRDKLVVYLGPSVYLDKILIENKDGEVTDPLWADTDGDGISDGQDPNPLLSTVFDDDDSDGLINLLDPDPNDADVDDDGWRDGFEYNGNTDMNNADTDGDGLYDGWDDANGDQIYDAGETAGELQHRTDPLDRDTDNDGLSDGAEVHTHGTDPLKADSDGDGVSDYEEVNAGDDGYTSDPLDRDSDADGLEDGDEVNVWNTDPSDADTDGDGLSDYLEVTGWNVLIYHLRTGEVVANRRVTSDPRDDDTDNDGLTDYVEFLKADPRRTDSDDDGYADDVDGNPVGIENIQPTITYFSYSSDLGLGTYKIKVRVEAEDQGTPAKIAYIKVKVSSARDSDTKKVYSGDFDKTLRIDWFSGAVVSGFDIRAEVKDLNGNVRIKKAHLDSFTEWVQGGVEDAWDWTVDNSIYYEITPFPRYWQGDYGLCAALSCLEIAHYYGQVGEDLDTVAEKSGDDDVYDGMYAYEIRNYLTMTNLYEDESTSPSFSDVKTQIMAQRDPILGTFEDYYSSGVTMGHAVNIVGYYDPLLGGEYAIVVDTNVTVVTYPMDWDYLMDHLWRLFYVDGVGMGGLSAEEDATR